MIVYYDTVFRTGAGSVGWSTRTHVPHQMQEGADAGCLLVGVFSNSRPSNRMQKGADAGSFIVLRNSGYF